MPATSGTGKRLIVVQSHQIAGSPGSTTLNALVAWGATNGSSVVNTPVVLDPVSGAFQQALIAPDYLLGSSTSSRSLIQSLTSRPGQDYLYSDGATSNRRIETQYGAVGAVAGSDLTEVDYVFDVPTSNPSSTCHIFRWSTNATDAHTAANALAAIIDTAGGLYISQRGAGGGNTDYREFAYTGFRAAYSGRRVRFTVAFSGNSATNPIVWVDGVDISSNFTLTTAGTAPWLLSTLATTYHEVGYNWPAGYFKPGRPVNRKYAQSDVDFVQVTGRLPYADAVGGSMVATYTSNFTSTTDTWSDNTGGQCALTANATGGGTAGCLQVSYASGAGAVQVTANRTLPWTRWVQVQFSYYADVGSGLPYLTIANAATSRPEGTAASSTAVVEGSWQNVTLRFQQASQYQAYGITATSTAAGGSVAFLTSGKNLYIKNFTVTQLGALSDPIIQSGTTLTDATPNGINSTLTGFTAVTRNNAPTYFGQGIQAGITSRSLPAWGLIGPKFASPAATLTDTTSSGTVASAVANSFGGATIAASSATTYTDAATVYIAGAPSAGTNATVTNGWGLWNAGKTRLDNVLQVNQSGTASSWPIRTYQSSLGLNNELVMTVGLDEGTYDAAHFGFTNKGGVGSSTNLATIGFAGVGAVFTVTPAGAVATNSLTLSSTTAATSTTTGALVVGSNVGLSGNAGGTSYFGGPLNVTSTGISTFGPGGTGNATQTILINGSNASGYGPAIQFQRNSVNVGFVGSESAFASNNSPALSLWSVSGQPVKVFTNGGTLAATFDSSQNTTLAGTLTVSGTGTSSFAGAVKFPSYAVASLPSASTSGAGATAYATDLTSTTSGSTAAGGGSGKHLVTSDGTNWIVQ